MVVVVDVVVFFNKRRPIDIAMVCVCVCVRQWVGPWRPQCLSTGGASQFIFSSRGPGWPGKPARWTIIIRPRDFLVAPLNWLAGWLAGAPAMIIILLIVVRLHDG